MAKLPTTRGRGRMICPSTLAQDGELKRCQRQTPTQSTPPPPPPVAQKDDRGRVIIRPYGRGWTPSSVAADALRYAIEKQFRDPHLCWSEVPICVKDDWWKWFQDKVAWDPHDHEAIFRVFNQRGAKRLSDILSKARKKGKKPKWMGDNTWVGLQDKWNDKVYQALSVQNKTNRASNKGETVHTIGRRSHLDVALDMAEKLGQSVDPGELFLFIHKKKSREWVDSCSERTYEAYQERLRQESMQMDEDSQEVDGSRRLQIWQSEVGGRTQGRTYSTADMSVNVRCGASSLTQESRAPTTTRTTHDTEATVEARQRAEEAIQRAKEANQRANEANQKVAMLEEQLRTIMALYAAERQSGGASCSQAPAPSPPPPPEHPHHYDAEHDNQSLDEADSPPRHRRRRS